MDPLAEQKKDALRSMEDPAYKLANHKAEPTNNLQNMTSTSTRFFQVGRIVVIFPANRTRIANDSAVSMRSGGRRLVPAN